LCGPGRLVAAAVLWLVLWSTRGVAQTAEPTPTLEPPMMLKSVMRAPQPRPFDVAADGRLLMLGRVPAGPSPSIEVIVTWRARVARQTSP
jgi:hypothetical protein